MICVQAKKGRRPGRSFGDAQDIPAARELLPYENRVGTQPVQEALLRATQVNELASSHDCGTEAMFVKFPFTAAT
jgi:hypothetical protein